LFYCVKKTLVETRVEFTNASACFEKNFYLSHQIFVLSLSAPCLAIAAFTFSVFTDNSEVG